MGSILVPDETEGGPVRSLQAAGHPRVILVKLCSASPPSQQSCSLAYILRRLSPDGRCVSFFAQQFGRFIHGNGDSCGRPIFIAVLYSII